MNRPSVIPDPTAAFLITPDTWHTARGETVLGVPTSFLTWELHQQLQDELGGVKTWTSLIDLL